MKTAVIAWTQFDRRTELLAQNLGASMHFIQYGKQRLIQAPVRYLVQASRSWRALRRDRPDIILTPNPPIFCAVVGFVYARLHRAHLVIDSHTGAFLSPRWRWSLPLQRFLSHRILTTIVHNSSQEEIVKAWGCTYTLLGYTTGDYTVSQAYPLDGQFNVAVVTTFRPDEPIPAIFAAARNLAEVTFYLSGDPAQMPPALRRQKPPNCRLTGYLPYGQYLGLLKSADVVMDLTTQDHTLLMGAWEAISLGKPLIVSDWPILREHFSLGTIHVANTSDAICAGVRRAQQEQSALRQEIATLRKRLDSEWEQQITTLRRLLEEASYADSEPGPAHLDDLGVQNQRG